MTRLAVHHTVNRCCLAPVLRAPAFAISPVWAILTYVPALSGFVMSSDSNRPRPTHWSSVTLVSALLLALLVASPSPAQIDLDELAFPEVFRGVAGVTSITHAGDGSGRLFVTEQIGRVLIYDGESLLSTRSPERCIPPEVWPERLLLRQLHRSQLEHGRFTLRSHRRSERGRRGHGGHLLPS